MACDVMEALMEEDMERLRARRRAGHHPGRRGRHGHGAMPSPSNSTFSTDSNGSVVLGLGTGSGIRDTLPLKSAYYDWCCEYFKEPQMRVSIPYSSQRAGPNSASSKLSLMSLAVCSIFISSGDSSETNRSFRRLHNMLSLQVRYPVKVSHFSVLTKS